MIKSLTLECKTCGKTQTIKFKNFEEYIQGERQMQCHCDAVPLSGPYPLHMMFWISTALRNAWKQFPKEGIVPVGECEIYKPVVFGDVECGPLNIQTFRFRPKNRKTTYEVFFRWDEGWKMNLPATIHYLTKDPVDQRPDYFDDYRLQIGKGLPGLCLFLNLVKKWNKEARDLSQHSIFRMKKIDLYKGARTYYED